MSLYWLNGFDQQGTTRELLNSILHVFGTEGRDLRKSGRLRQSLGPKSAPDCPRPREILTDRFGREALRL